MISIASPCLAGLSAILLPENKRDCESRWVGPKGVNFNSMQIQFSSPLFDTNFVRKYKNAKLLRANLAVSAQFYWGSLQFWEVLSQSKHGDIDQSRLVNPKM